MDSSLSNYQDAQLKNGICDITTSGWSAHILAIHPKNTDRYDELPDLPFYNIHNTLDFAPDALFLLEATSSLFL